MFAFKGEIRYIFNKNLFYKGMISSPEIIKIFHPPGQKLKIPLIQTI